MSRCGGGDVRQAVTKNPVFFAIVIAVLLVAWWFIGFILSEATKLRGHFDWSPPEEVHPEDTFEESIGIMNEDEDPVLTFKAKDFLEEPRKIT